MNTHDLKVRHILKNDSSENWNNSNIILLKGELGLEYDNNKIKLKIGDGIKSWNELDYVFNDALVEKYKQNTKYEKDSLIYLDEKIARVLEDFVSDNTYGTEKESFDEDVKTNKISIINTDHVHIMREYIQSNSYTENHLVYLGDLIARVKKDFIADGTIGNTVEDSFQADVTAGNILVLNKEAEPGIIRYKQNTLFKKDKLVFADRRIARVMNDYISDNTGLTLEESINIDIEAGHLLEIGERYKFKLYKTSQDIDKTIDAINILPISTITFENNDTIDNMEINEAIYDPLGTLTLIKEIDKNNGIIKAKTVNSREMEFMPPAPNSYTYTINLQGTGYSVGEIMPTDLPNVNVEIQEVGLNGEIVNVIFTNETITNALGTGASISAELVLYGGNGKEWYEIPKPEESIPVKEYKQGISYNENELVFLNDVLTRVNSNFISNNTLLTIEDSFKFDLDNGNLIRMTREDVNVPECLGSVKTDSNEDLPLLPIKGNWVLINNCVNSAPGQPGIGLYNGTSWDINPIPQGTFTFPEPLDDGKLYFRKRESGQNDGEWDAFSKVDGNDIEVTLKTKSDLLDNSYIPKANELVWDTNREILVIGDGSTTLGNLKAFYGQNITSTDIVTALGFTPENTANKGQANGYAPLDANGIVPIANLPASLTDTYSKTEIDDKDADTLTSATALVNTESARAQGVETTLRDDLDNHINDTTMHVTQAEKDSWDAKVDSSDLTDYDNHINNNIIHVTQAEKDKWNGMNKAHFVTNVNDLPATDNQVGNVGYVQTSAAGVTPIVCDQYIWDGTSWKQLDAQQVSLSFTWGNLIGKPASTPLSIDNSVTIAHTHNNKTVLDKIGQSAAGNFTYDGKEIGVRVVFVLNESLLPPIGELDTLYVVYEDGRVRNYPSISVYRDNSYQILGRGTQDSAPQVGDMNILQAEYFSVLPNSTYKIMVTSNQFFSFMPLEILKEIEGLKNQTKEILNINDSSRFDYDEDLLTVDSSNKLTISIKEKQTILDTVSNFYYSHVDVDLSNYKDIDNIG